MIRKSRTKPQVNAQKSGNIRIIAGKYRGRKLPVIDVQGLRPTTDRVKETVFNWLMPYINNAKCLDCFAGSGSLGFEAISRGAAKALFLELNKQAAQQIEQNIAKLSATNANVVSTDALKYLQQTPADNFNLVFLDPPFRKGLLIKTAQQLTQGWLAENALIYIEAEAETEISNLPSNWQLLKEKVAGQVAYRLYKNS
jgi:16S rRNA (guanine966-N2)-methyltransferase